MVPGIYLGPTNSGQVAPAAAEHQRGDLVIVVENNLPTQQWLLGRIIASLAEEDDMVRVVDIRTSGGGVFRWAIHKLAPLR